jgi:hypothetical protein
MTETTITATRSIRNGVDTATMFATLDAIKGPARDRQSPLPGPQPVARWHARSLDDQGLLRRLRRGHHTYTEAFTLHAGEPAILLGTDTGPNPAEYLLHALAACVTTSLVYSAVARKVNLTMVESTLESDLNVEGAMGTNTSTSATGSPRSGCRSASPATPRPTSCARSSSAGPTVPWYSTRSRPVSQSPSTSPRLTASAI